jgi:hypothetical protein
LLFERHVYRIRDLSVAGQRYICLTHSLQRLWQRSNVDLIQSDEGSLRTGRQNGNALAADASMVCPTLKAGSISMPSTIFAPPYSTI